MIQTNPNESNKKNINYQLTKSRDNMNTTKADSLNSRGRKIKRKNRKGLNNGPIINHLKHKTIGELPSK